MSPFLLAFEAISVTSPNGLVARFCELQCNIDVSVDFKTTERVSITQEGNLIHDRLCMKISVDDHRNDVKMFKFQVERRVVTLQSFEHFDHLCLYILK